MKMWKIAVTIPIDQRLIDAAHQVVDKNRKVLDVAEEFHLDPNILGDEVLDLRREIRLNKDEIVKVYLDIPWQNRTVEKISKMTGKSIDDVAWVLRRSFPQTKIRATPSEIKTVIEMRRQNKDLSEIIRKTRLSKGAIIGILQKHVPDMVKTIRSKDFGDTVFLEYLELVDDQGKTHQEAMNLVKTKYPDLSTASMLSLLRAREYSVGPEKKQITPEEDDIILKSVLDGKSFLEIGEQLKRNDSVIRAHFKRKYTNIYNRLFKRKPKLENLPVKGIQQEKVEKVENLKEEWGFDISDATEEGSTSFGDLSVRPMSPEKYDKSKFLTREEIEEIKRQKVKALSLLNWYKLAQEIPELSVDEEEKFIEQRDEQYCQILQEYYNKKRKKGSMMSWDVIPFARLKKIWTDYARTSVVRDEKGMQAIADQMIRILARLNASNDLSGHGQRDDDTIKELTGYDMPDGQNWDFYFDFLETKHGSPVSDYGLPKLNAIASALMMTRHPIQQLMLVDQMLNVIHQRGDLSALFVEGGRTSLDQLAGK